MNPFRYRPAAPVDPDDGETDEWADNWLSNYFAWASRTFLPHWCDTPPHWTSRLTEYLWTSCPCCLLFRGLTLGYLMGLAIGAAVVYILL